jgi:hypothetical protein
LNRITSQQNIGALRENYHLSEQAKAADHDEVRWSDKALKLTNIHSIDKKFSLMKFRVLTKSITCSTIYVRWRTMKSNKELSAIFKELSIENQANLLRSVQSSTPPRTRSGSSWADEVVQSSNRTTSWRGAVS